MFPNIMKSFLGFFLIFAVPRSSVSLMCEECKAPGTTCLGSELNCKISQDVCAVILVENTEAGPLKWTTIKTCMESRKCRPPIQYLNMGKGRYERSSIVCCTDTCNTAVPRFPPGFIRPNGKECPTCLAADLSLCGSDMVDCSGYENHCIEITQIISLGTISFNVYKKGCATRNICNTDGGTFIVPFSYKHPRPTCTRARFIRKLV